MTTRRPLALALLLLLPGLAPGQITWQFNYLDQPGQGFYDPTVPVGETRTLGQLRRDSLQAAAGYLTGVLDGRGTVVIDVRPSVLVDGDDSLGSFAPGQYATLPGTFQGGGLYQAARTGAVPFAGAAGSGGFNFAADTPWNYAGQVQPRSGAAFDLTTVAVHELVHGAGFLSLANPDGSSRVGPGVYATFDQYLQRGSGPLAAGRLFDTTRGSAAFGSFVGPAGTFTNENRAADGLFFGGPLAREVFGGPVPLFAPTTFQAGSSVGHVNDPAAVMNPFLDTDQVRRLLPYERAMLLDVGWNASRWDGSTSGTWAAGATDVAASRWRSDQGVVFDGQTVFNAHRGNPAAVPAPVLPPTAGGTGDRLLEFAGTGPGYTATNDLGTVGVARVRLANPGPGLATLAGDPVRFGTAADGTNTVLAPQVIQAGAGPARFALPLAVPAGDDPLRPRPLAFVGPGTGEVTLAGGVGGTGGLQKDGAFALVVAAPTSFTGPTEVLSGPVRLTTAGGLASSSAITVGLATGSTATLDVTAVPGGFALAAGQLLQGAGTVVGPVAVGAGTVQGGTVTALSGTLTVTAVTVRTGSTVAAVVGASGASTRVAVAGAFTRASAADRFTLRLRPDGASPAGPWTVLTFASTDLPAGTFTAASPSAPLVVALADGTPLADWSVTVTGGTLLVTSFTPVPEPAVGLLLAAGGLWLWRRAGAVDRV